MNAKSVSNEITLEGFTIYTDQKIGGPRSEVCIAVDQDQCEFAAKKILSSDQLSLEEQYRKASGLCSKYVLKPTKLLKMTDDKFYLISERGTSNLQDLLAKQLKAGELLSPKLVFNILSQLIEGLNALHGEGITHGNLRPTSILIFGSGDDITVKLSDYEGFPGASADHSSDEWKIDTRLIQSPEFLEDAEFDEKCDIW